jgi:hypothetical protein
MDTNVIVALLPALAAGFAVQRLVEVVDPIVVRIVGEDRKKVYLGLLSLIVGIGLASLGALRVLHNLGVDVVSVVDYIVTGLIISAGTDGINSILKFLNYKKEEQKQETVAMMIDNNSLRARFERRLSTTTDGPAFTEATGDLPGDLESSLKDQIKRRFPTKFKEEGFGDRTFDNYVTDPGLFAIKEAVIEASDNVAQAYNVHLSEDARRRIQDKVALGSSPKKILPKMEIEVESAQPINT